MNIKSFIPFSMENSVLYLSHEGNFIDLENFHDIDDDSWIEVGNVYDMYIEYTSKWDNYRTYDSIMLHRVKISEQRELNFKIDRTTVFNLAKILSDSGNKIPLHNGIEVKKFSILLISEGNNILWCPSVCFIVNQDGIVFHGEKVSLLDVKTLIMCYNYSNKLIYSNIKTKDESGNIAYYIDEEIIPENKYFANIEEDSYKLYVDESGKSHNCLYIDGTGNDDYYEPCWGQVRLVDKLLLFEEFAEYACEGHYQYVLDGESDYVEEP